MPQPPPSHYELLGRLTAAASMSELQLGLIGWGVEHGEAYTDDWSFADRPGKAIKLAKRASASLDDDLAAELSVLIHEHERLVLVRHRGAHGVLIIDPTLPPEEQWITRLPSGSEHAITEFATAATAAIAGLHAISKRASALHERAFRRAI